MDSSIHENPGLSYGPYMASDYDFEKTLRLLYGDRYYLQASQKGFRELIALDKENYTYAGSDAQATFPQLLEIAKRALEKEELDIAEKSLSQAIKTEKLTSNERNVEPYLCLAEIHEKRACDENVGLLQRQRFLLQAAALYNFVVNFLKTATMPEEQSIKITKTVLRKLHEIQDNLVLMVGGNPLRCNFDSDSKRNELEQLRFRIKDCLANIGCPKSVDRNTTMNELDYRDVFVHQAVEIKKICEAISLGIKEFFAGIIKECVRVLGEPPCDYEVIVLGSLARNEVTPYSDVEWAVLTSSDEEECKIFFRNLTNLVHLQIINLGETILPSMDIKALKSEWFFDDITPRGVSFDAFLPQACKTPLGNIKDFELIHTPKKMAEFQSSCWYEENPGLSEILMTVSPLEPEKHGLVDEYRKKLADILDLPCDLHEHDDGKLSTRGSCRGFQSLQKDLSHYGDAVSTGDNEFDEGKLYDVKKEIYRLTDRVVSGLAICFGIEANAAFDVIDELLRKGVISSAARNSLASASAIGLKLRISTYLKAGKQGEELKANPNVTTNKSSYHMPQDEELFHFFYVAIPLYDELRRLFLQGKDFVAFSKNMFFDCRDAIKASIYSRVLDYTKAIECYERALKSDPNNVNTEIRELRLLLIVNNNAEAIRHQLDCLLENIFDVPCNRRSEEDAPNDELLDRIFASVHATELRQLLEILMFLSSLEPSHWHFKLAEMIFDRFMTMKNANNVGELQLLVTDFAYLTKFSNWQGFDSGITELSALIDNGGVSTKSITCLNKLAEIFSVQGKYGKSYKCLQRALAMERTLYGNNPNLNVMKTLHLLGTASIQLFMFMEGQFYLEQLLQQFDSFDGPRPRLLQKQTYLQLAILCSGMDRSEEAISHLQKGLALPTDRKHAMEQNFGCVMQCEEAKLWHTMENNEEAMTSVLNAKDYLPNIATESKVPMTCYVSMTFHELGMSDKGISLLNEELQQLDVQSNPQIKATYLISLGRICNQRRQTEEAEIHFSEALEIFSLCSNNNAPDVLKCLLELSDILAGNGKPLEARRKLEDAMQYVLSLNDKHEMCNMFKEVGERWEKFGEIFLASSCYGSALSLCKDAVLVTNIPFTEFSLELELGDLAGKATVGKDAREYESYVTKEQRVAAQRRHYDSAGSLLQQYSTRGNFDSLLIDLFLLLASKYATIDVKEREKLLLNALEINNVLYGPVKGNEISSTILYHLFHCYLTKSEYKTAADVLERSLRIEMDEHSSDSFHPHICHRLVFFSVFHLINSPTSRETSELLAELFESCLNDEGFAKSNVTVKANAAHCFTFLSVVFWCYNDFERAIFFNKVALELFDEIKEQGIPENRSSSQVICGKMEKILEDPSNPFAAVQLLQHISLQIGSENDMWGFLNDNNTQDRLKNVFESVFPSFFIAKDVNTSSLLPQFIALYDQYSSHIDTESSPHLTYSMELLRQLSRRVYGENPVIRGESLDLSNLLELLPFAQNAISSLFPSGGGTSSSYNQVLETVASTNYGAVIDHSVEDLLTNSFNVASLLLATANTDGSSSVLGSLLSGVTRLKVDGDSDTVPPSLHGNIKIDDLEEVKGSELAPASIHEGNSGEPVKEDNDNDSTSRHGKVNLTNLEKEKDSNSMPAANESNLGPSSSYGTADNLVEEDESSASVTQPVLVQDVDIDSRKKENQASLLYPAEVAMKVVKNLVAQFFGKDTDRSVDLKNKDTILPSSVEAAETKDIEPRCPAATPPTDKALGTEDLSEIKTIIDALSLGKQTSHLTQFETTGSPSELEHLETVKTYLENTLGHLKQKYEAMRQMITAIQKLADARIGFLEKGEFQKYMEAGDRLSSLVKSLVKLAPKMVIEKCLTNAAENLKTCKTNSARSSISIAAQCPRSDRQDAMLSKMSGDCDLLEGNYRLAIINFTRAADYYSSDRAQEPGDVFEYLETLIGLIKANILCERIEDAWLVCQDGVAVVAQLKLGETTSQQTMKICYLSAKCLFRLSNGTENGLEKAISFCQQGLAASKVIDEKTNSSDLVESLGENGELYAIKCEIQLLFASILLQLNKQEDAEEILTDIQNFLSNVAVGFETFTAATWERGQLEFFKISCRLFAWIGRAFVINGQAKSGYFWLAKSLSALVAAEQLDILFLHEESIPLLDAITTANAAVSDDGNSFGQTVEMCKQELLEKRGNVNILYLFLRDLGYRYMGMQRASEAIIVYESALVAAECMSDSVEDQRKRASIQLHLGHAHRLLAENKSGGNANEERALARKFYKTEESTDLHSSTLCKKLSLAFWHLEESEFAGANVLLQELLELGDKLADIPVVLRYFSRYFYGPVLKGYIEEHGESMTTLACLVYSLAVFVYVGIRMTREAVLTCEKLSIQRDLNEEVGTQPSLVSYLLAACHRKFSSHVNGEDLHNCVFPLSTINLAKLYYQLKEYELVLKCCSEILKSVDSTPNEKESSASSSLKLTCLLIAGNTYVQLGNYGECYSIFTPFLEVLHSKKRILDVDFEKQCAILDEYSFADRFYIFCSFGMQCAELGNPDGAIKCYEKCLEEDEHLESHGQGLIGTLAELYQSKALLAKKDQMECGHWMKLAHALYLRLFQKTTKILPYVESSYGLFLCKVDRHREAIDHFLNVIKGTDDTMISFGDEDKPLLDLCLSREIEVRGSISLPLKVFTYHLLASAYMEVNEIEKAQESALALESYVSRSTQSSADYPLLLSVVGYTYTLTGDKEKALSIFVSVLEEIPEHTPVIDVLESYFLDLD